MFSRLFIDLRKHLFVPFLCSFFFFFFFLVFIYSFILLFFLYCAIFNSSDILTRSNPPACSPFPFRFITPTHLEPPPTPHSPPPPPPHLLHPLLVSPKDMFNSVLPTFPQVSSESFATPQTSVAARRVARGRTMPPRATSAPPRPLYAEVDYCGNRGAAEFEEPQYDTTTIIPPRPYVLDLFRYSRPLVVLARPRSRLSLERARSVPPALYYQGDRVKQAEVVPVDRDWRWLPRAARVPFGWVPRARSVPYDWVSIPRAAPRRRYRSYERAYARTYETVTPAPLPTAGLRATRVPRRFMTRTGLYYDPEFTGASRRQEAEDRRLRPRVLASPLARAALARAYGRGALTLAPYRTRFAFFRESVTSYPLLYTPRKATRGRKVNIPLLCTDCAMFQATVLPQLWQFN